MTTTMTASNDSLIHALRRARGRRDGVTIERGEYWQTATTGDGEVWVFITDACDAGEPACYSEGDVPVTPAMRPVTFRCGLTWWQIDQIVHAVVPATDTETSRYALGGVQLECREGGLLAAVGTDGRRLHAAWLQPSSVDGETPQYCIVPAAAWRRFEAVCRDALRGLRGISAGRLSATLQRGSVTIETDATIARLTWSNDSLTVTVVAGLIGGRFPRWREIVDPCYGVGEGLVIDHEIVGAQVGDYIRRHRAAVAAGKAAWLAEPLPGGARRRKAGEYKHPRGVTLSRDRMEGRGCEWTSAVGAAPNRVTLDPQFLIEALGGCREFAPIATVRAVPDPRFGGEVTDPVVIEAGGEYGERFVAVVMPLAIE